MKILINQIRMKVKNNKDLENERVLQDHQDHRSNQRQRSWKQHTSTTTTKSKSDRESIDIIAKLKWKKGRRSKRNRTLSVSGSVMMRA